MIRPGKILIAAITSLLLSGSAFGQAVQQSGTVTPGHIPWWITNGVIGDAGTSADSPITSIGVTGPICSNSARISTGAWNSLCIQSSTTGPATISLQNNGTASPQNLNLVINGTTISFGGGGAGSTFATVVVPTTNGANVCFSGTLGLLIPCPSVPAGAATLVGNPTTSATAPAAPFTIQGLTARGAPDANNDKILLYDNAAAVFKYVTPGLIASSATAGVSSFGGQTGAIVVGTGLTMTGSTVSNTGVTSVGGQSGAISLGTGLSIAGSTISANGAPSPPQGRITLTSGTPVTTTDVVGATVAYYDPASGSYLPLTTDGVNFVMTQFAELSQATTDTAKSPQAVAVSSVYDIFGWLDSSTVTITIASPAVISWTGNGFLAGAPFSCTSTGALPTGMTAGTTYYVISAGLGANSYEFASTPGGSAINTSGSQSGTQTCTAVRATRGPAWASGTSRGTGAGTSEIDFTTKFPTNKRSITSGPGANLGILLGSVRSNSSSQLMDSALFRWTSNIYNAVPRSLTVQEATATWAGGTATVWRSANNSAANAVAILQSLSGGHVGMHATLAPQNNTQNTFMVTSVGINSTTVPYTGCTIGPYEETSTTSIGLAIADCGIELTLGNTTLFWLENYSSGTATFNGAATFIQSGLTSTSGVLN